MLLKIIAVWCIVSIIFTLGWMVFQDTVNPRSEG